MESGEILGLAAMAAILVVQVSLTARFVRRGVGSRSALLHGAAIILISCLICGLTLAAARWLNVVDSSHGFVTIGLPVLLAFFGSLIAFAILGTRVYLGRQRRR